MSINSTKVIPLKLSIFKNRLWHCTNPTLPEAERAALVKELMQARLAAVKNAKTNEDVKTAQERCMGPRWHWANVGRSGGTTAPGREPPPPKEQTTGRLVARLGARLIRLLGDGDAVYPTERLRIDALLALLDRNCSFTNQPNCLFTDGVHHVTTCGKQSQTYLY